MNESIKIDLHGHTTESAKMKLNDTLFQSTLDNFAEYDNTFSGA